MGLMSAQTTRRSRNGAVVTSPKPSLKATSSTHKSRTPPSKKPVPGKENSRAGLPTIRPIPPVTKAAVECPEGRVWWPNSSAFRGRSPTPSVFIQVFRDSKIVEKSGGCDNGVVQGSGKINVGTDLGNVRVNCDGNEAESEESVEIVGGFGVSNGNCVENGDSSSKQFESNEIGGIDGSDLGDKVVGVVESGEVIGEKCISDVKVDCFEVKGEDFSIKDGNSENLKGKGLVGEGSGDGNSVKYPNKLREKLAFLEGKVKRIASDINKTKEMLDMNNPEASKVILYDIQDKISGIEKAMGCVTGGSVKCGGSDVNKHKDVENCDDKKVNDVKGLNSDELEARLFPHYKLLRSRVSMKTSSVTVQIQCHGESNVVQSGTKLKDEENPIALGFLASLGENETHLTESNINLGFKSHEVKEVGDVGAESGKENSSATFSCINEEEISLTADETLDDFDGQENILEIVIDAESKESATYQVNDIGSRNSTGGWFVSEGESVLLAHDDGSCSYYDIVNCEEKAVYKPPVGIPSNIWQDCWIVAAPNADGCAGRYVVAASAGNTLDSGFCSWDFYTKELRACHIESGESKISRTVLGPLSNDTSYSRTAFSCDLFPETKKWCYRPCGPLIMSAASSQKVVRIFDIRDGEQILKWEMQKPISSMDHSSPVQWRNRGKAVVAEAEVIRLWDVNSLSPHSLVTIPSRGGAISALHVNNTDGEVAGVRQRVTSVEAEGKDGVFCTADSINVLDFRHPTGVGLKIPKLGVNTHSVFTRCDSVYIGCENMRSNDKKKPSAEIQHYSLRKQRLVSTYALPNSSSHPHHSAIVQVWGNSNYVMGVCGNGLFVFDKVGDHALHSSFTDFGNGSEKVKEVIGPDDLYLPSFDYCTSRALLISRDRRAMWRQLV